MATKRRGLGRGIEALIPPSSPNDRPSDIFFSKHETDEAKASSVSRETPAVHGSKRAAQAVRTEHVKEAETHDRPDSEALRPVPGVRVAELDLEQIQPNSKQPRQVFDEEELDELASSIKEVGLLQPIVVRENHEQEGARFELIMGHIDRGCAKTAL